MWLSTKSLDSAASRLFSTTQPIWMFFAGFNVFLTGYLLWQIFMPAIDADDPYPFQFLNLIIGFFSAEMAIIIVVAQIVASIRGDTQTAKIVEVIQKTDQQTDLLAFQMENNLVLMRSLEEMGFREAGRDHELHTLVREGHLRFTILEKLLNELKKKP